MAYRLNMIRQQLNLDQMPTAETILSYSEHLLAEAEELTLIVPVKATSAVKAAALSVSPPPGIPQKSPNPQNESDQKSRNPKKRACRYWMSEKGCSRGDQCHFGHANLDPHSNRCFNCSAVGHSRRDCHLKIAGSDSKPDPTKKRVAKVSKPSGKGAPEKSGKGFLKKLLGMLPLQRSLLVPKPFAGLGRKLGTGEKTPLKGSLGF